MKFGRREGNKIVPHCVKIIADYGMKHSIFSKDLGMKTSGSNLRTNGPNIPPKDIQAGHEFIDRSLKTR